MCLPVPAALPPFFLFPRLRLCLAFFLGFDFFLAFTTGPIRAARFPAPENVALTPDDNDGGASGIP